MARPAKVNEISLISGSKNWLTVLLDASKNKNM